jgi:hypothetical protein
MAILVISACSGDKRYDDIPIGCETLDSTNRSDLLQAYSNFVAPAAEMYTGDEHEHVQRAVANLRKYADVTWKIVSAGYGLVAEDEELVADDCSFTDIDPVWDQAKRMGHDPRSLTIDETRRTVGRELNLPNDMKQELASGYDLVFIVLSEPYLVAVADALVEVPDGTTVLAFASKGSKPHIGDAYWVPATGDIRAELGTTWFELRGKLLHELAAESNESALGRLAKHPGTVTNILPVVGGSRLQNQE